jgi:hypothetical protein
MQKSTELKLDFPVDAEVVGQKDAHTILEKYTKC